jgi:hypothetical protein
MYSSVLTRTFRNTALAVLAGRISDQANYNVDVSREANKDKQGRGHD